MSNQPIWGFPNQQAITTNELGGLLQYVEVNVTSAQLLNLDTVGASVLPALANPNQYYYIDKCIIEYSPGTTPYVATGTLYLNNAAMIEASANILVLTDKAFVVLKQPIEFSAAADNIATYQPLPQGAVELFAGTSPTAGDGTLKVKMWYSIQQFI